MSLIKLILEYDGTDFVGWQFQKNGRSVQEEVEKAIKQILQIEVRITAGGRTDAGVHARGQVASFKIDSNIDLNTFVKSVNAVLPDDVVVKAASYAPDDFSARYSAKSRRYTYNIMISPTSIQRDFCWQILYPLNYDKMQKCTEFLKGEHDFYSFCKADTTSEHHRCIVSFAKWIEQDDKLIFEITSNRFLYGMVRALVGTMVDVGRNHTEIEKFVYMLNNKDRQSAGMHAPARGLFLEEIVY